MVIFDAVMVVVRCCIGNDALQFGMKHALKFLRHILIYDCFVLIWCCSIVALIGFCTNTYTSMLYFIAVTNY